MQNKYIYTQDIYNTRWLEHLGGGGRGTHSMYKGRQRTHGNVDFN